MVLVVGRTCVVTPRSSVGWGRGFRLFWKVSPWDTGGRNM